MADSRFFSKVGSYSLGKIAEVVGVSLLNDKDADILVEDVAPLDRAEKNEISFLDNTKYIHSFGESKAGAVFVRKKYADLAPAGMAVLISDDPYRCYAKTAQLFYPSSNVTNAISPAAHINDSAIIGANCSIAAGAFIGENVEIGDGCVIGANAVLHDGVKIGDNSYVGAVSTLSHCYIGERVIIHRGVHIGQDGFGFALGKAGHVKVPQLGRVIIEDDVEIGSGSCIDRGTGPDTVIGAGSKIDNLVQIGHNVRLGRGVVLVSQSGVSGSSRLGDGVVVAGKVGIAGHLNIGAGARIAGKSGVTGDIPAGASVGGFPAVPIKEWHRQSIAIARLGKKKQK